MREGPGGPLVVRIFGQGAALRASHVVQGSLWGGYTGDLVALLDGMYRLPYLRPKGVVVFLAS